MGAARHDGIPMLHCELEQPLLDAPQVPPDQAADPAQGQRRRGVGDVLDGGPGVDVAASLLGQRGLQGPDQAQHGMRGLPCLRGRVTEIDPVGPGVLRDQYGRAGRDQPGLGLDAGQRRDHLEPDAQPAFLAEHRPGLIRSPQVPV